MCVCVLGGGRETPRKHAARAAKHTDRHTHVAGRTRWGRSRHGTGVPTKLKLHGTGVPTELKLEVGTNETEASTYQPN